MRKKYVKKTKRFRKVFVYIVYFPLHLELLNYLDSTCVLIGLQVGFHSAMKHENDVSNMLGVSKLGEFTVS